MDDGDAAQDAGLTRSARRALRKVDVYPKMHGEFKVQTEFGATSAWRFLALWLGLRACWPGRWMGFWGGG